MKKWIALTLALVIGLIAFSGCAERTLKDQGKNYLRAATLSDRENDLIGLAQEGVTNVFEFRLRGAEKISLSTEQYHYGKLVEKKNYGSVTLFNENTGTPVEEGFVGVISDNKKLTLAVRGIKAALRATWKLDKSARYQDSESVCAAHSPMSAEEELELGKAIPVLLISANDWETAVPDPKDAAADPKVMLKENDYSLIVYLTFE